MRVVVCTMLRTNVADASRVQPHPTLAREGPAILRHCTNVFEMGCLPPILPSAPMCYTNSNMSTVSGVPQLPFLRSSGADGDLWPSPALAKPPDVMDLVERRQGTTRSVGGKTIRLGGCDLRMGRVYSSTESCTDNQFCRSDCYLDCSFSYNSIFPG